MSFLQKIFGASTPDPKHALRPLYDAVIAKARQVHWYEQGHVADSIDGRFDMVAAMLSIVLLRFEARREAVQESVYLTEIFVDDMDGQLREIGIGDMIVGKHLGRIMGALGGRLGAYRKGIDDPAQLESAIIRNIFRGQAPDSAHVAYVADAMRDAYAALLKQDADAILMGNLSW